MKISNFLASALSILTAATIVFTVPLANVSAAASYNGIDLTKNSTAYDVGMYSGNVMYNEAVMFHTNRTQAKLLYPIKEVISVRSYDLQTEYQAGRDYTVTSDGQIKIPSGSTIKVYQNPNDLKMDNISGSTGVGYMEANQWKYQYHVTYTHDKNWKDGLLYDQVPLGQLDELSFVSKAKAGKTVNVVFYGDSITVGCSTSGMKQETWGYDADPVNFARNANSLKQTLSKASKYELDINNLPDWVCETWPKQVAAELKKQYGNNIKYYNRAVGSSDAEWAANSSVLKYLLASKSDCPEPDLLFIAFGMNGSHKEKAAYVANIETIIKHARKSNPDCSIVLVSPFYPNFDHKYGSPLNLAQFEEGLYDIDKKYENVAVVPVFSIFKSMQGTKDPIDYTNNCWNHPNDFGARVYAKAILSVLSPSPVVTGITDKTHTGKAITQNVAISYGGKNLKEGTDFEVSYKNNTDVGTAKVVISLKGDYTGTITKTFEIKAGQSGSTNNPSNNNSNNNSNTDSDNNSNPSDSNNNTKPSDSDKNSKPSSDNKKPSKDKNNTVVDKDDDSTEDNKDTLNTNDEKETENPLAPLFNALKYFGLGILIVALVAAGVILVVAIKRKKNQTK